MAQSTKYINQQKDLQADLIKCQNYIAALNDFMATESANIDMLQSQLTLIDTQIQSLQKQINLLDAQISLTSFIYITKPTISFLLTPGITQTNTFGLSGRSRVYLYANKTVSGLQIDGVDVTKPISNSSTFFHSIDPYQSGQNIQVKCKGISNAQDVSIYFSDSSTWTTVPDVNMTVSIRMLPQIVVPNNQYIDATNMNLQTTE